MATIGSVTKRDDGRYEGELRTLSIRADVTIVPVTDKVSANQPDFRVLSQGIEIGAGWVRKGQTSVRPDNPISLLTFECRHDIRATIGEARIDDGRYREKVSMTVAVSSPSPAGRARSPSPTPRWSVKAACDQDAKPPSHGASAFCNAIACPFHCRRVFSSH